MIGVVDPQDVERAARLLVDEPAIVGEVMDQPQAGDRQRDRRMRPLRGELFEEAALERLQARTEVAGDEGARRVAVDEAGVAQETAMDEAGRRRRLLDRPHHPGRGQRRFVGVRAGPAGGALDAGRQLVGIGEQQQRLAADAHRCGSRPLRGRRRHGRPAGSSDSRRPRRRGRGVRAQAAPQAGGRVVVGARGGAGAEREGGGENEAGEARGQGGSPGSRRGRQVRFANERYQRLGRHFARGRAAVKGRRLGASSGDAAEGRRGDTRGPRVIRFAARGAESGAARRRRRRPNRPRAAPFLGATVCFQRLARQFSAASPRGAGLARHGDRSRG